MSIVKTDKMPRLDIMKITSQRTEATYNDHKLLHMPEQLHALIRIVAKDRMKRLQIDRPAT